MAGERTGTADRSAIRQLRRQAFRAITTSPIKTACNLLAARDLHKREGGCREQSWPPPNALTPLGSPSAAPPLQCLFALMSFRAHVFSGSLSARSRQGRLSVPRRVPWPLLVGLARPSGRSAGHCRREPCPSAARSPLRYRSRSSLQPSSKSSRPPGPYRPALATSARSARSGVARAPCGSPGRASAAPSPAACEGSAHSFRIRLSTPSF